MGRHVVALDREGKITIPVEMRRTLNLHEGDAVVVSLANGQIRVAPYEGVATRTAGMLAGPGPVLTAEELREAAAQAIADDAIERMGPPGPDSGP